MWKTIAILAGVYLLAALVSFCVVIIRPLLPTLAGLARRGPLSALAMIVGLPVLFVFFFPIYVCAMSVHLFIGAICFITRQPPPIHGQIDDNHVA